MRRMGSSDRTKLRVVRVLSTIQTNERTKKYSWTFHSVAEWWVRVHCVHFVHWMFIPPDCFKTYYVCVRVSILWANKVQYQQLSIFLTFGCYSNLTCGGGVSNSTKKQQFCYCILNKTKLFLRISYIGIRENTLIHECHLSISKWFAAVVTRTNVERHLVVVVLKLNCNGILVWNLNTDNKPEKNKPCK